MDQLEDIPRLSFEEFQALSTEDLLERQRRRTRNDQRLSQHLTEMAAASPPRMGTMTLENGWTLHLQNFQLFDGMSEQEKLFWVERCKQYARDMITLREHFIQTFGNPKPKREHTFTQATNTPLGWECAICLCAEKNDIVES